MLVFLISAGFGFLMCFPVGPINVSVVTTGLNRSYREAFAIALGGALMDIVYFFVILSSLSLFTLSFSASLCLKTFGVLFLFVFGIKELRSRSGMVRAEKPEQDLKRANHFLLGALLHVSNPSIIAVLSGIAAVMKSFDLFADTGTPHRVLASIGIGIGSAGYFYLLLKILKKYRKDVSDQLIEKINRKESRRNRRRKNWKSTFNVAI